MPKRLKKPFKYSYWHLTLHLKLRNVRNKMFDYSSVRSRNGKQLRGHQSSLYNKIIAKALVCNSRMSPLLTIITSRFFPSSLFFLFSPLLWLNTYQRSHHRAKGTLSGDVPCYSPHCYFCNQRAQFIPADFSACLEPTLYVKG